MHQLPVVRHAYTHYVEQGVFEAIRMKYLKVLSFGFYMDRDEKSIIESYEFKGVLGKRPFLPHNCKVSQDCLIVGVSHMPLYLLAIMLGMRLAIHGCYSFGHDHRYPNILLRTIRYAPQDVHYLLPYWPSYYVRDDSPH